MRIVNLHDGSPQHCQRTLATTEHVGENTRVAMINVMALYLCHAPLLSQSTVLIQHHKFSGVVLSKLMLDRWQVPPPTSSSSSSHPSSLLATERATCLRELQGATSTSREAREIKRTNLVGQASFLKKETLFLPDLLLIFIKCSGSANVPATIGATKTSN